MGGVVSQSIPNFLNGMSQQTPTQRGINQGEDQVNFQNSIVEGLSKRPSSVSYTHLTLPTKRIV